MIFFDPDPPYRLKHYGIRGCINEWFKSYLKDRKQYVCIYGFNSSEAILKHGVPQGSVLGPLWWPITFTRIFNAKKLFAILKQILISNYNCK